MPKPKPPTVTEVITNMRDLDRYPDMRTILEDLRQAKGLRLPDVDANLDRVGGAALILSRYDESRNRIETLCQKGFGLSEKVTRAVVDEFDRRKINDLDPEQRERKGFVDALNRALEFHGRSPADLKRYVDNTGDPSYVRSGKEAKDFEFRYKFEMNGGSLKFIPVASYDDATQKDSDRYTKNTILKAFRVMVGDRDYDEARLQLDAQAESIRTR